MSHGSKPSENGDLIGELKQAEERAAREVAQAAADKEARIKKAHESAASLREKTVKDAIELKAKLGGDERKKIGKEEAAILAAAGEEAEALKRKRVGDKPVEAGFRALMGELDA